MRLKPSKQTISILGGICALILIAAGVVVYFQKDRLDKTMKELTQKRDEVKKGQTIANERDQARSDLAADQTKIRFLETGVSEGAYVPTLLRQLEELAKSTRNRVLSVRPQIVVQAPTKLDQRRDPEKQAQGETKKDEKDKKKEKPKVEPYTPLSIALVMIGDYKSVQAFTDELNRFPKIMAVEKLVLTPRQTEIGVNRLDVQLELTAFIMKENAAPAPADAQKKQAASAPRGARPGGNS